MQHGSVGTSCGELGSYFCFAVRGHNIYNLFSVIRATTAFYICHFYLTIKYSKTTGNDDNKDVKKLLTQLVQDREQREDERWSRRHWTLRTKKNIIRM